MKVQPQGSKVPKHGVFVRTLRNRSCALRQIPGSYILGLGKVSQEPRKALAAIRNLHFGYHHRDISMYQMMRLPGYGNSI